MPASLRLALLALSLAACNSASATDTGGDEARRGDEAAAGDGAAPGDAASSAGDASGDPGPGDLGASGGDDTVNGDAVAPAGDDVTPAGDAAPTNPLEGIGLVEAVAPAGVYQFLEGPQWRANLGVLLFSDIPASTIYRYDGSEVLPFRNPSDNANGLGVDTAGLLLACEHGSRRVSRTLGDGSVVTVADSFEGARLNSPNDVVVRSDGTLYFTDPQYGINDADRELDFEGVFRVTPVGLLAAEWRGPLSSRPNGIALSPDETTLYVTDTTGSVVRAFDVDAETGALTFRSELAYPPSPDGMAVDQRGNLFVSSSAGIMVYAPDGSPWGTIPIAGDTPANCAFGDPDARTLYVTAGTTLHRVRLAGPGLY